MHNWILIMALIISCLSLAAVGIVCRCCRKMRLEKDRRIVEAVREKDELLWRLEHTGIEKETLERVLIAELKMKKCCAPRSDDAGAGPMKFDPPYSIKKP